MRIRSPQRKSFNTVPFLLTVFLLAAAPTSQLRATGPNAPLFLPAVTYGSGGFGAVSVVVEDLNGDDKPDLVVANYCGGFGCSDGTVGVLLGNGDGTFRPAVTYDLGTGNSPATSMAVADVNGDGKADIVVTVNVYVVVLLGNGDGTFQPPVAYDPGGCVQVAPCANGVAVADVNGDGKLDLLVTNTYSRTVGILLGKGDGTFQTAVTYGSGGSGPISVAAADLDGDGKLDIVVTNDCLFNSDVSCAPGEIPGTVGMLLGNGNGTFREAVTYVSGGSEPSAVAVADVNGDGRPDLVVSICGRITSCADVYDGLVGVLLGNGDGTFQSVVTYDSGGTGAMSVAVADVNSDGKPDVLVGNRCAGSCFTTLIGGVGVLLGNGDGTFQSAETYASGNAEAKSIAVADLNGDREPDLAVANSNYSLGSTVGVLLNNTADTTPPAITLSATPKFLWPSAARKLGIRLWIMMRDQIDYEEFCRRGKLRQKGEAHAGMPAFDSGPAQAVTGLTE